MRVNKTLIITSSICFIVSVASLGLCAKTQHLSRTSFSSFIKGQLKNLALNKSGYIYPLAQLERIGDLDEIITWDMLALPNGDIILGCQEKLLYISENAEVKTLIEVKDASFCSLVGTKEYFFVASGADSSIYRINSKTLAPERWVTLPVEYVWSLALTDQGLFVGTGSEGKLWFVNMKGETNLLLSTEERHLQDLALDKDGNLYIAGEGNGLLYKYRDGKAILLYDSPDSDITALDLFSDGSILLITNEISGEFKDLRQIAAKNEEIESKCRIIQVKVDGTADILFTLEESLFYSLKILSDNSFWVGSGHEGWLFYGNGDNIVYFGPMEELEITAFSQTKDGLLFATTNPTNIYKILISDNAFKFAEFISDVISTGDNGNWGICNVHSNRNQIQFATRTGTTQFPNDGWSEWTSYATNNNLITSPSAPYIQFKLKWNDPDTVNGVYLSYTSANRPPKFTSADYKYYPDVVRALKDTDFDDKNKPAPAEQELIAMKKANRPIKINWDANDPDSDALEYKLEILMGKQWVLGLDWSSDKTLDLMPDILPEGTYELRIIASDKTSNSEMDAQTDTINLTPILIDNTSPEITDFQVAARNNEKYLTFTIKDNLSPIALAQWATFDGDFQIINPIDRIFDQAVEKFEIKLPETGIAIRTLDVTGNMKVVSFWAK